MQQLKFSIEDSRAIQFILAAGCLINFFIYSHFGAKIVNDSPRYMEYSNMILANGFYIDRHNIWYVGYVFFLSLCKLVGLQVFGIVALQSIISMIASVSVYFCAKNLTKSNVAGLAASLFFLLWIRISQWNMYILCESLYISFTAITCFFLLKQNRNYRTEIISIVMLLFTAMLKPTGVCILIAGLLFYIFHFIHQARYRIIAIVVLAIGILSLGNTMLYTYRMIETYASGDIIFGCTATRICPDIYVLDASGVVIPESNHQLIRVFLFFVYNPWLSIKLAFAKLIAFLIHIKPFYSIWNNLFIAITLFPAYYFSISGIRMLERNQLIFVLAFLISSCLTIMSTVEDWDGRFLMPLLPLIFVLAIAGVCQKFQLKIESE